MFVFVLTFTFNRVSNCGSWGVGSPCGGSRAPNSHAHVHSLIHLFLHKDFRDDARVRVWRARGVRIVVWYPRYTAARLTK